MQLSPIIALSPLDGRYAEKMGNLRAVGPILMGLSKPLHVLHRTLDVSDIVDMAAIAVVDAQGR